MKMAAAEAGDRVLPPCVFLADGAESSLLHWHGAELYQLSS